MAITGLTSTTKKNLQLDAGAIFKNYIVGSDTPETATAKLIGATVGGATFSAVPEVRQVSVDGVKGPTKGFEIIDSWTATLTANIKEVNASSIALALGATTINTTAETGYSQIKANADFADGDYLTNITWVGKISGSTNPIIIVLKNPLNLNGFSLAVADKAEGQVPIVMTAHYDPANIDAVPFEIYAPTISTT